MVFGHRTIALLLFWSNPDFVLLLSVTEVDQLNSFPASRLLTSFRSSSISKLERRHSISLAFPNANHRPFSFPVWIFHVVSFAVVDEEEEMNLLIFILIIKDIIFILIFRDIIFICIISLSLGIYL